MKGSTIETNLHDVLDAMNIINYGKTSSPALKTVGDNLPLLTKMGSTDSCNTLIKPKEDDLRDTDNSQQRRAENAFSLISVKSIPRVSNQ